MTGKETRIAIEKCSEMPIKRGPWTILGSEFKYSNPWIKIREDKVLCPDGTPGIYGVVEAKYACGVVAIEKDQQSGEEYIYLVGQYRYPTERYSWETIQGGAERDEEPLAAIKRELREEAGFEALKWDLLASEIQLSNCYSAEIGFIYLAQVLTDVGSSPDPTEELQVKRVRFTEAQEMILRGEITDAFSILGIYFASMRRELFL